MGETWRAPSSLTLMGPWPDSGEGSFMCWVCSVERPDPPPVSLSQAKQKSCLCLQRPMGGENGAGLTILQLLCRKGDGFNAVGYFRSVVILDQSALFWISYISLPIIILPIIRLGIYFCCRSKEDESIFKNWYILQDCLFRNRILCCVSLKT